MTDQIAETLRFLLINPVIAVIALVIALAKYWGQMHLFRRVLTKQSQANMAGWNTQAIQSTRRHDSGIGAEAILVMRPPRRLLKIAFWTLLFFGGGALFYCLVVLPNPDEQTAKNWLVFAIMCAFSVLAVASAVIASNRIRVSADDIVLHRLFRSPKQFALKEISSVELAGKNPATGVKLSFFDGRHIRLFASYEGYAQVLENMQNAHPDLPKVLMLGRLAYSASRRA